VLSTLRAAVVPTARGLAARSLGGVTLCVMAPTLITLLRGGQNLALAVAAAALIGGAGIALGVDDDAEVLLAASPTPLAARRALRVAIAAAIVGVGWVVVIVVGEQAALLDHARLDDVAVEALAAAGVGVAGAVGAQRWFANDNPGVAGVAISAVSLLTITALSTRLPALPAIGLDRHHDRWLWVAAAAWGAAAWLSRDPARRMPSRASSRARLRHAHRSRPH
jgi:hypothetical protein